VETGERYSLNQDEIYQRNLSDLYFLLEDYDNAYSNYKFFSGEIKVKQRFLRIVIIIYFRVNLLVSLQMLLKCKMFVHY